jgi:hypothetical protein
MLKKITYHPTISLLLSLTYFFLYILRTFCEDGECYEHGNVEVPEGLGEVKNVNIRERGARIKTEWEFKQPRIFVQRYFHMKLYLVSHELLLCGTHMTKYLSH